MNASPLFVRSTIKGKCLKSGKATEDERKKIEAQVKESFARTT